MTNFLVKLFVRDSENTENIHVRERYGKFAGIVGVITNFILFLMKVVAGLVFHSIAIIADAVNNLSDSASSVVTLIGFKLSGKPADKEHPYGHARMEYISGLIVSFVILLVGFQLLQTSAEKVIHPEEASFTVVTFVILAFSMLIKLWQCMFYRNIGKRISSTTLRATATDSLNDVFSTLAILIGALITSLTGFNLDGYMGIAVAVFIMVSGVKLIIETSNPLLGMAPSKELVNQIYAKIMGYKGILGIHDLSVHNYGPGRCFASVHCEVDANQDILISHDIIDNIERDFLKDMEIHLVIHLDPIVTDNEPTNELRRDVRTLLAEISPQISMHDFRVVWGATHSNLIFDVCVPFGFFMKDKELVEEITKKIQQLNERYFAVVTVDHDYIPTEE